MVSHTNTIFAFAALFLACNGDKSCIQLCTDITSTYGSVWQCTYSGQPIHCICPAVAKFAAMQASAQQSSACKSASWLEKGCIYGVHSTLTSYKYIGSCGASHSIPLAELSEDPVSAGTVSEDTGSLGNGTVSQAADVDQGSDDQGSADHGSDGQGSGDQISDDQGSSEGTDSVDQTSEGSDTTSSPCPSSSLPRGQAADVDQSPDDQGSDDQGSADQGSANQGSDDQGSADQGSADQGSDDTGSDDKGSDDPGTDDQGSDDRGSDDKGSADEGSDDQGSDDEGSDDQGSGDQASNDRGSDDQGSEGTDSVDQTSEGSDTTSSPSSSSSLPSGPSSSPTGEKSCFQQCTDINLSQGFKMASDCVFFAQGHRHECSCAALAKWEDALKAAEVSLACKSAKLLDKLCLRGIELTLDGAQTAAHCSSSGSSAQSKNLPQISV